MREVSIEEQAENSDNVQFGDDRLGVLFLNRTVEDKERTLVEGRKCFKSREFVRIMVPGDRHNIVERPVQITGVMPTDDRMRFPTQYAKFKNQQEQKAHDGTPLNLWPQIPESLAEELKFVNIFTVEQLAELGDNYVGKIPMGQSWKAKAKAFVEAMKDTASLVKMQTELEERDNRITALETAVADQATRIEALLRKLEK